MIHTLTLIRWPLEFGHNFSLHRVRPGEAILFSRLDNPLAWFRLSAGYSAIVWLLFIYDHAADSRAHRANHTTIPSAPFTPARGPISCSTFESVVPLLVLFNLACAVAIWRWPDLFVARDGHLWLISAQIVSLHRIPDLYRPLLQCDCAARSAEQAISLTQQRYS